MSELLGESRVSQAAIVIAIAFGLALFATIGVVVTLRWERRGGVRRIVLLGIGAMPLLLGWGGSALGVRVNLTPSMPLGLYRIVAMQPAQVTRGALVAVCPPKAVAVTARWRGYLLRGACPEGVEPVLKRVIAVGGDVVLVTPQGIVIDGRRLPDSTAQKRDSMGRRLIAWPPGRYRLMGGSLWVYADHPRSWDSRYWGPVSESNVLAVLEPLLIVR